MDLNLSIASRDRFFAKAMRRVRLVLQPFLDDFGNIVASRDVCDAILVGITDGEPEGYFKEIENNDNYFQVLIGCAYLPDDQLLLLSVFDKLTMAINLCPLSDADRISANAFVRKWRDKLNSGNQPQ